MGTEVESYKALQAMMGGLEGDGAFVEFEIIAGNRAKYSEMLFSLDQVIGYAKDLRLIEYRVEDSYDKDHSKSRKRIFIYKYGTHPDTDERIIRRGKDDPSGNWERYFPRGIQNDLLQLGSGSNKGSEDNPDRGRNYLPPKHS